MLVLPDSVLDSRYPCNKYIVHWSSDAGPQNVLNSGNRLGYASRLTALTHCNILKVIIYQYCFHVVPIPLLPQITYVPCSDNGKYLL